MEPKKLKIREAVVVEGKYDKIRLSSLIDGVIVETGGFAIFKDRERMELIRALARTRGIVILTDSDGAGQLIRSRLSSSIPPSQLKNAFIPEMTGKEKRKTAPSRAGTLGVEGMDTEILLRALKRAGVLPQASLAPSGTPITRGDLYELGLTGVSGSKEKRERLLASFGLPRRLSPRNLIEALNAVTNLEQLQKWLQHAG